MSIQIESYGKTFDTASLPEASVRALFARGLNHVLGNEVASKVTAWKGRFVESEKRDPSESEIDAARATYRDEMVGKIAAGTLGVRAVGVSADPVEALIERLAWEEIDTTLKANKYKWDFPKGADGKRLKGSEGTVALPDGKFTKDELIERRLAKHGDRLRAAAEKQLKARARKLAEAAGAGLDL